MSQTTLVNAHHVAVSADGSFLFAMTTMSWFVSHAVTASSKNDCPLCSRRVRSSFVTPTVPFLLISTLSEAASDAFYSDKYNSLLCRIQQTVPWQHTNHPRSNDSVLMDP